MDHDQDGPAARRLGVALVAFVGGKRNEPRLAPHVLRAATKIVSLESETCVVGYSRSCCLLCRSSWSGARRRRTARMRPVSRRRSTSAITSTSTKPAARSHRPPTTRAMPWAPTTPIARVATSGAPQPCKPTYPGSMRCPRPALRVVENHASHRTYRPPHNVLIESSPLLPRDPAAAWWSDSWTD